MRSCVSIVALLLLAAWASEAAGSIAIFYPPDKAIVTTDTVALDGIIRGGKPNHKVEIKVSGRTLKTMSSLTGVRFSDTLVLAPGVNSFMIIDQVDGKYATIDVFYNDGKKTVPAGYYVPVRHAAVEDGCDSCHAEEGGSGPRRRRCPTPASSATMTPRRGARLPSTARWTTATASHATASTSPPTGSSSSSACRISAGSATTM